MQVFPHFANSQTLTWVITFIFLASAITGAAIGVIQLLSDSSADTPVTSLATSDLTGTITVPLQNATVDQRARAQGVIDGILPDGYHAFLVVDWEALVWPQGEPFSLDDSGAASTAWNRRAFVGLDHDSGEHFTLRLIVVCDSDLKKIEQWQATGVTEGYAGMKASDFDCRRDLDSVQIVRA